MEFRLLGPLEVVGEDGPLSLGGKKQRALLTLLLLERARVVSRDRLIDALWGERPPKTAAHTVQVFVSDLRRTLGQEKGRLITQDPGYRLVLESGEIDAGRFEQLLTAGSEAGATGRPERAARILSEALSLWRGPALADFAYEPFAVEEAALLEELRLACLEQRIEADLALGRHSRLVGGA